MSNALTTSLAPPEAPAATVGLVTRALDPLTDKEEAFCVALVETNNMAQAYRRAYKPSVMAKATTIQKEACEVGNRPRVRARCHELQEAAASNVIVGKAHLAMWLWNRMTARRSDVVRQVQRCCRHCYGVGHAYQWKNEIEYADACVQALEAQKPLPSDAGGYGFDPHLPPVDTCDVEPCLGAGTMTTVVSDTRDLQGGAAAIYEGVDRFGMPILANPATDAALFMKLMGWSSSDLEGALRGAAAGGAAGALAAAAVVDKVKTMDAEDTRRAYLSLVGG